MTWRVIVGDCRDEMRAMEENSVDAIVTDPPYGLEFMGKEWDRLGDVRQPGDPTFHKSGAGPYDRATVRYGYNVSMTAMQQWHETWAREALRVLKPGGHLLAFGGTRTYHRLVCAVEDAGFEIRDTIAWLYGSGFPKSLDVSKAIDKAAGAEREVTGRETRPYGYQQNGELWRKGNDITAPATPEAQRWQGWGTALKPSHEPIVLARKPLSEPNVAANVQRWGTGALNIDGTRIPADYEAEYGETWLRSGRQASEDSWQGPSRKREGSTVADRVSPAGRWPPNLAMDEEAALLLDEQSGESVSPTKPVTRGPSPLFGIGGDGLGTGYGDRGGASRFMYVAKADRAEREVGLGHIPRPDAGIHFPGADGKGDNIRLARNHHPTVKPVALMQWLVKMVTPPGGLVLDPFTGSGSTGIAALREGFNFLGIEMDEGYAEIARDRILGDAPLFNMEGT